MFNQSHHTTIHFQLIPKINGSNDTNDNHYGCSELEISNFHLNSFSEWNATTFSKISSDIQANPNSLHIKYRVKKLRTVWCAFIAYRVVGETKQYV